MIAGSVLNHALEGTTSTGFCRGLSVLRVCDLKVVKWLVSFLVLQYFFMKNEPGGGSEATRR
jgi:hypothetical protein